MSDSTRLIPKGKPGFSCRWPGLRTPPLYRNIYPAEPYSILPDGKIRFPRAGQNSQFRGVRAKGRTSRMLTPVTNIKGVQTRPESGVRHRAVAAQIIPPVRFRIHAMLRMFSSRISSRSSRWLPPDLTNAGTNIHGGNGLSVFIQAHIEGFNLLRVVVHDDGAFKMLLRRKRSCSLCRLMPRKRGNQMFCRS